MERSAGEDVNEIVNVLLAVAKGLIDDDGTFAPFGAVVDLTGEVAMVVPVSDEEDVSMEVACEMAYADLRERAAKGEIRCSAVCLDIRMREPKETDAILIAVEHAQMSPMNVYMPYAIRLGGPADYGEHWAAEQSEARVFF